MTKVRVRYAQVQLGTCILEMQELHYSIICLPATMMETLLFVLRILTKNVISKMAKKPVGKPCLVGNELG